MKNVRIHAGERYATVRRGCLRTVRSRRHSALAEEPGSFAAGALIDTLYQESRIATTLEIPSPHPLETPYEKKSAGWRITPRELSTHCVFFFKTHPRPSTPFLSEWPALEFW